MSVPKFICDAMFSRLGKWLRAAGYDTEIVASNAADQSILELAKTEQRYLITRDRYFVNKDEHVIFLENNSTDACAMELKQKLQLDWLVSPFTRCMECNTELVSVKKEAVEVPRGVYSSNDTFWKCPTCKRIYWLGSHTTRMHDTLYRWATSS